MSDPKMIIIKALLVTFLLLYIIYQMSVPTSKVLKSLVQFQPNFRKLPGLSLEKIYTIFGNRFLKYIMFDWNRKCLGNTRCLPRFISSKSQTTYTET